METTTTAKKIKPKQEGPKGKKEVWPAMSMIVERGGLVKLEEGRLQVTLRRFKDREIDYAARHLCEDLNRMSAVTLDRFHFPIRYQVQ